MVDREYMNVLIRAETLLGAYNKARKKYPKWVVCSGGILDRGKIYEVRLKSRIMAGRYSYIFTCAERQKDCPTCRNRIIAFHTDNIELAGKHSRENNARMWIAKKEEKYKGTRK